MTENKVKITAAAVNRNDLPGVLILGEKSSQLADILADEDIRISACSDSSAVNRVMDDPSEKWHIAVIRDGGIDAPSFELIEQIRQKSGIPLLTVSDSCTEIYRIMALAKGADACMDAGNDFGIYEFKARIVSMLRRTGGLRYSFDAPIFAEEDGTLRNGGLMLDRRSREVFSEGKIIPMTSIEYGIVEYLMENCGSVCSVEDIYRNVWNSTPYSVKKTIVEHIRRIRVKIEPDPHKPMYIKAVFGVGYRMEKAG